VIAIFPVSVREDSSVPFARTLNEAIKEYSRTSVRIGVGRLARRLADFPTSFREAREALFIASITGETKSVQHYNDLGVWRLLLRIEDETELERFSDYYLSPVSRHDREQQTDWLKTLETFLDLNGNLRATARALALHRNTITYQLEHISKLLGQDLNNPEVRLNLQVALRAVLLLKARKEPQL
jgi:purine catabolism regulator